MALTRKKRNTVNPFVINDINLLDEIEEHPAWLEDILIGCIRAERADKPYRGRTKREAITVSKIVKVYKRLGAINFTDIQTVIICGTTTAALVHKLIKLSNLFIIRYLDNTPLREPEGVTFSEWRDPASSFALGLK